MCFSLNQFKGDSTFTSSIPTGGVNLTSTPYDAFTSFGFISCLWKDCKASSGGGIFYQGTRTEASLTIIDGEFFSCKATTAHGGGIYAQGLNTIVVRNMLFSSCSAGGTPDYGGGGVEMVSITTPPKIHCCLFLSCISNNDAGGMGILNSPRYQTNCIFECFFLACEGKHSSSTDGGSLMVWSSNGAICCSNTLFTDSRSAWRGGAASYLIYSNANHNSSIPLFTFCLFKNSTSLADYGNDIFFGEWKPTEPFLHCFSTTREKRICYYSENIYHSGNDNWLPQGIVI